MDNKIKLIITLLCLCFLGDAQIATDSLLSLKTDSLKTILPSDTVMVVKKDTFPQNEIPTIEYNSVARKKYKIQAIDVTGAPNYEDFVLIGYSGLSVGDMIEIPGDEITEAINRFWKQGLFSHIQILASRIVDDKAWLEIRLKARPRIYEISYNGVKKGERTELENRLNLRKGYQITPHVVDVAKKLIRKFFEDKGFKNVDIDVVEKPVPNHDGEVAVNFNINKNEKTKIEKIYFAGNEQLTDFQLRKAMKKTNEGFNLLKRFRNSWLEMFSTKKFTDTEYEADKKNIISKYNELGYRDAEIIADSVTTFNKKKVNIHLHINEGQKYYIKDIKFVGNTKYPSDYLEKVLNMKPGEVYNQKKLTDRMFQDNDAMINIYQNNGYIFSQADPVEVEVKDDSITLEVRIYEGSQATINKIVINGNDRLYEDIIRRELRTKPGDLYNRDALMRSLRELSQMGHFDPENMQPDLSPNHETGTIDLIYNLTSKANDQVEFSLGWGQTGLIGKLGLKFTNFSMTNLLNTKTYKGIIPQGEGQTLNISGQTNASYYQSYSISFLDPWFGGKRPNTLSVSAHFSRMTDVNQSYYSQMQQAYLQSLYNSYNPYYGNSYGSSYGYNYYENAYDKSKYMQILGVSVGYGKRLHWPDDYFNFMATLNYQMYMLSQWSQTYYLGISEDGNYNDINLELALQRSSIDNPFYTRFGSQFTLTGAFTFPYSLVDGKDYANITSEAKKFKFVEYYKMTFKAKTFIPLLPLPNFEGTTPQRTPVLMTRVELGWIGEYNKHKKSPFGTYYVGGDGMTGGYMYYQETVALRGYDNGSISGNNQYMGTARAYSRLSLELRYPLILEQSSTIYALLFGEAGNAWSSISDFDPFNMKRSAGVGVRIFLPMIGMMGIDWGYGFDRVLGSSSPSGGNFHFILGQEF
ncbi:MAG: outer membrane protein assembly factor BamA [Tannerella sp.]|jgi:outer membrane protein insertion porin family|nr:outer membrane protein assembly factor BamA [Tannerella sp.]